MGNLGVHFCCFNKRKLLELVDNVASKAIAERRKGSSPLLPTKNSGTVFQSIINVYESLD